MAKARLRRGIEIIKLANRIEALKMQEDDEDEAPADSDLPTSSEAAAVAAVARPVSGGSEAPRAGPPASPEGKRSLSAIAKQSIFREVVKAKVRETKEAEQAKAIEAEANEQDAKKKSF